MNRIIQVSLLAVATVSHGHAEDPPPKHPVNTWVKVSPSETSPVSPRMGYEGACVWDNNQQLLVRYGGHNQGGGGEQGAEVWTFDPLTAVWKLKEPNTSPPGVCCNAQNVYAPLTGRYVRFPLFSGSHGWQWWRELYLNDSSVWTYDLTRNRWRNSRPLPEPRLAPYRCASWDAHHQVVVVFGGEGGREGTVIYDPWRNEWRWPRPEIEPAPRSGGSMAYDAHRKLHVLFGSQFSDDRHTWTYDVERNQWRDMKPKTMPPTNKNDAVLTYDSLHRVVLALVKVTSGEGENAHHDVQTWSYDTDANVWTRKNPDREPDAAGNRTRNLVFAPELNLAILENCTAKPREQQIWTYRLGEAKAPPSPQIPAPQIRPRQAPPIVEDVVVSVLSTTRVAVHWPPSTSTDVHSYHVERAPVEVWSEDQLTRLKSVTSPLAKPSAGAIRRIGAFERLTKKPVHERSSQPLSFVDTTVNLDRPIAIEGEPILERTLHAEHLEEEGRAYGFAVYCYRVRAVSEDGQESGPSAAAFTIPSSPQHLFSRENGVTCELKWEPNPEMEIRGYRVYRMNGRWNKDPVARLTSEPLTDTTFADKTAGERSRRYYVVAVDAIGQEGFPSSPTWFLREWRAYYKPFTGAWHQ